MSGRTCHFRAVRPQTFQVARRKGAECGEVRGFGKEKGWCCIEGGDGVWERSWEMGSESWAVGMD